jgi:hypothetical protein
MQGAAEEGEHIVWPLGPCRGRAAREEGIAEVMATSP